jgi:hypothetical protein
MDPFTADLNDLRVIGAIDLPMLAYAYALLNNAVAGTASADTDAFRTEPGGPPSLVTEVWRDLRDELQNVLGLTAENLHNAGQIVLHIVQAYADTDESAAAALRDAWQDGIPPDTAGNERILPDQAPDVRLAPA